MSELRSELKRLLPTKSLRRKTLEGLNIIVIDPEDVTLSIAEYRPVYVNGDVSRPGEQPFRLGMTVRQAVAVSGGYDLLHYRADQNPIMQAADLRSEYQSLWTEFAQAQAQMWRVGAELSNKSTWANENELRELPVAPSVISEIVRYENQRLALNNESYSREKSSLIRQIEQSDDQAALITEQLEKTKQGVQLAVAALENARALFERGLTPASRVMEERRLTLLTQTQNLQTTERLGQVRREREDLVWLLATLENRRSGDLSRELQDSSIRFASAKVRLQAVEKKLTLAGVLKSQLTLGKGTPELVIFRKTNTTVERISADEDTEMLPGDTVEVSLKSQAGIAAAE